MRRSILPALLLAFLWVPAGAAAADRHASASSTRTSGECTIILPCTLPYANSIADAGDRLILGSGTYDLGNSGLPVDAGVQMRSLSAVRPVVKGIVVMLDSEQHSGRVDHLELTGLYLGRGSIGSDLVLRGGDSTVYLNGNAVLRNSLVTATSAGGHAVGVGGKGARLLSSTVIASGADATGILASGSSFKDSVTAVCFATDTSIDIRNTIVRGSAHDVRAEGAPPPSGCASAGTAEITINHSNYRTARAVGPGQVVEGPGNQTSAAQTDDAAIFADTTLYRQRNDAPTQNAGAEDPLLTTLDLDGDARIQEGAVDIGADELPAPPQAVTQPAADVTQSAATLRGLVAPNARETRVVFEYGPTAAYGSRTVEQVLAPGSEARIAEARVEGLTAGTPFHYRVLAFNADGVQPRSRAGADATFSTLSPPAVVPTAGPSETLPDALTALRAKRSLKIATFLRRGLKVGVVLGRAATAYDAKLTARLLVRGKRRTITLGHVRGTAGAGPRTLTLTPSRRGKTLLRRAGRVNAKLTLKATPAGGSGVTRTRSVTLRR